MTVPTREADVGTLVCGETIAKDGIQGRAIVADVIANARAMMACRAALALWRKAHRGLQSGEFAISSLAQASRAGSSRAGSSRSVPLRKTTPHETLKISLRTVLGILQFRQRAPRIR